MRTAATETPAFADSREQFAALDGEQVLDAIVDVCDAGLLAAPHAVVGRTPGSRFCWLLGGGLDDLRTIPDWTHIRRIVRAGARSRPRRLHGSNPAFLPRAMRNSRTRESIWRTPGRSIVTDSGPRQWIQSILEPSAGGDSPL